MLDLKRGLQDCDSSVQAKKNAVARQDTFPCESTKILLWTTTALPSGIDARFCEIAQLAKQKLLMGTETGGMRCQ